MGNRARKALGIGVGAIVGATLALGVDLAAAMMALGDGPDGWDKTLAIAIMGGPIAIVVGAILVAIVRGRRSAANTEQSLTAPAVATWRSHHPISWIAGLIASVVVGMGLLPIVWGLMMLAVYVGRRSPLTYPVASFLVAPAVIYYMVKVGRAVMRLMERKIRGRNAEAEASGVWLPD